MVLAGKHPAHTTMSTNHYTFGDSDVALARLDRLAAAYEVASRAFLRTVIPLTAEARPRAVDLGCGPGNTTRLVAAMVRPRRLDAYDASERYVAIARERLAASALASARAARVHRDDVTTGSFARHSPDLIYARHLLTHVAEPGALLQTAAAALAPHGILAVEETAGLDNVDPFFHRYYQLVEALQARYGQRTTIGRDLGELASTGGLVVIDYSVRAHSLPAATMAALHGANIATWKHDPFAAEAFDPTEVADLERYFASVAHGRTMTSPTSAPIGQLIVRARSGPHGISHT